MKTTKEIAKEIRVELKKEFPEYKFSVTSDVNEISVSVMSGPDNLFEGEFTYVQEEWQQPNRQGGYAQLNHFYIEKKFNGQWTSNGYILTEKAAKMLIKVVEISNRQNWNRSNIEIDYFDVNYYFNLNIGKWNRDYIIK